MNVIALFLVFPEESYCQASVVLQLLHHEKQKDTVPLWTLLNVHLRLLEE